MKRRAFLLTNVAYLTAFAVPGYAEDCSPANIAKWKQRCREALEAAAKTTLTGDSYFDASVKQFGEAVEPSYKCLKGGYDILQAAFKDPPPTKSDQDHTRNVGHLRCRRRGVRRNRW